MPIRINRDFLATSYIKAALVPPETGSRSGTIRHKLSRAWLNFFLAGSTIAPLFYFPCLVSQRDLARKGFYGTFSLH